MILLTQSYGLYSKELSKTGKVSSIAVKILCGMGHWECVKILTEEICLFVNRGTTSLKLTYYSKLANVKM